jgi:hypothetical protein
VRNEVRVLKMSTPKKSPLAPFFKEGNLPSKGRNPDSSSHFNKKRDFDFGSADASMRR